MAVFLNEYKKNLRCYPLPPKCCIGSKNPLRIISNEENSMENEGGTCLTSDDQNDWGGIANENVETESPQSYRSIDFYEKLFNEDSEVNCEKIKTALLFDYSFLSRVEIEQRSEQLKRKYDGIVCVFDKVNIGNYLLIPYINPTLLLNAVKYIDAVQNKGGTVLVNSSAGIHSIAVVLAAFIRYKKYLTSMAETMAYIRKKYGQEAMNVNYNILELYKFENELIRQEL